MAAALRISGVRPAPGAVAFADTRLEWRRLLVETGGTFFLVLVAAGAGRDRRPAARPVRHGRGLAWALRGPPSSAADLAAQGAVIYPGEGHDRF